MASSTVIVAETPPIVFKELSADYTELLGTTMLAIMDSIEQTRRRARQKYLDIKEFCEGNEQTKKIVSEALWNKSDMQESNDRVVMQEIYFSLTVMIFSLTLGTLVGNLWTELDWLPQLGIFHSLVGIGIILFRIWDMLCQCPSDPKERVHRSRLFIALFALGFCLGRLCSYFLPVIAPRMFAPFVIAILIDKKFMRTGRIEFFLTLAALVGGLSWIILFVFGQTHFVELLFLFLVITIKIGFFYGHFQLIYHVQCAHSEELRKAAIEISKEDNKAKETSNQPPKGGCCSGDGNNINNEEEEKKIGIDQWKCISHFSYILVSVIGDTIMAFLLG